MEHILQKIRSTKYDKTAGMIRIVIGMIILSTGVMKLLIPMLWNAWSGQLTQANIPFIPLALIAAGAWSTDLKSTRNL